jgi:hypothetical protein
MVVLLSHLYRSRDRSLDPYRAHVAGFHSLDLIEVEEYPHDSDIVVEGPQVRMKEHLVCIVLILPATFYSIHAREIVEHAMYIF